MHVALPCAPTLWLMLYPLLGNLALFCPLQAYPLASPSSLSHIVHAPSGDVVCVPGGVEAGYLKKHMCQGDSHGRLRQGLTLGKEAGPGQDLVGSLGKAGLCSDAEHSNTCEGSPGCRNSPISRLEWT